MKLGIEEIHPVDLLEALVRETHELQLLGIALLAAVVIHILLALGGQLGLGVFAQGDACLLRPGTHHGVQRHRALGILHGVLAEGHGAADGGVKVHGAHVGAEIVAVVGQPVEVLLGGDGLHVHGHEGGVGMNAGGSVKHAVGALAVGHVAQQSHAGHQQDGGQQTGQCADNEVFHVVSPSVPSVFGRLTRYCSCFSRSCSVSAAAACREFSFSFRYNVR